MSTAMSVWGCNVTEAAHRAAGFSEQTVHKWAASFYLWASTVSLDDEFITDKLSSDCRHCDTHADTLLYSEDFQLAARKFVRNNACHKGEPNLTSHMFAR